MREERLEKDVEVLEDWEKRVSRLEDVKEALERSVNYLSDLQKSLDEKTLPKMGSDIADLEKRLTRVEHMTGPHLLVERQDKEKRVQELERRMEDLEEEVRVKHNG